MDGMQRQRIKLPATLDLAAAQTLLETLRQATAGGASLMLDAGGVDVLTSPCAQIILAALRTDSEAMIVNPSPGFSAALDDLGLQWRDAVREAPIEEAASAQSADQSADESDVADRAKRILTIDDSKTMRDMLMLTLAAAGYDVIQGVDGQDGIEVLGDEPVDVVITDINMPRMDGYEVIRKLRDNPHHKSTPILVLTTESDAEKRTLARSAGATGWMVKPFDPDRLLATVRKVCP